jgi:transcriptional regulator
MRRYALATITSGTGGLGRSPLTLREPARTGCCSATSHVPTAVAQGRRKARLLVVFQGPQHYISQAGATKAETGRVVPTWNYEVVHVRGRIRASMIHSGCAYTRGTDGGARAAAAAGWHVVTRE